jgi:hypothetical protein
MMMLLVLVIIFCCIGLFVSITMALAKFLVWMFAVGMMISAAVVGMLLIKGMLGK